MSRLRKGGKYKGGSFAKTFKVGLATRTPFSFVTDETGQDLEKKSPGPVVAGAGEEPTSDITDASKDNASEKDIIPSDTEYSREEVDSYFQRRKLAKERAELEALKKQQEEEAATEAEIEEEERESLSQGENIEDSYDDEYDSTMTGKERREESRENKRQIRDAKKEAKAAAKDEFKNKKQAIKDAGLKGKDKRDAKK